MRQDHSDDSGLEQFDRLPETELDITMPAEETEMATALDGPILHSFECSDDKTETDLSDDGFTNDVLKNLNEARKDGSFCDITLLIGPEKQSIKAHRLILASASDYFKAMFNTNLKEGKQSEVGLPKTDMSTMNSIIDFIYTGKLKVSDGNVEKILTAANFFGISKVVTKCVQYIIQRINNNNSIQILEFAERISNKELKNRALIFVTDHFEEVSSKNLDIMEMSTPLLLHIIIQPCISIHQDTIENEERLFHIGWNHLQTKSEDIQEKFLPQLLKAIHLPVVSDEFMKDLTRKFGNCETVNAVIEKAKYLKSTLTHLQTPTKQYSNDRESRKNYYWVSRRYLKSGTVSVTCNGLKNKSSLFWLGMSSFIHGIAFALRASIVTSRGNGPPVNYLVASVESLIAFQPHVVYPFTIEFRLVDPQNSTQSFEVHASHTFKVNDRFTKSVRIMKVTDIFAEYYDDQTESCTLTAKMTLIR